MQSLEADELISVHSATVAENCYLDDDAIKARNGYRAAIAALVTSGAQQGLWRFRPSPNSARTVSAIGGKIHSITDPTTELLSNGATALAGTPFGSTANISAAQLGKYLYLATDESAVSWNRMDSSYALVGLGTLAQAAQSAFTLSSLAVMKFSSLAAPSVSNMSQGALFTDWFLCGPSASGGYIEWNLGADADWTPYGWVMMFVSPDTQSHSHGGIIQISVSTSGGTAEVLGSVYDTNGPDSPTVVAFDLNGLTPTTRAAVRKIRFTATDAKTIGFAAHGYMLLPLVPTTGGGSIYNVTFYNSTTKQESALSPDVTVTYAAQQSPSNWPMFHQVTAHETTFRDDGNKNTYTDTIPTERFFNRSGGKAWPAAQSIGALPTFTGTIPVSDRHPLADYIRLWRVTQTGRRLVKAVAITGGQTTYSVTDDQGDATLTHDLYRPQGTPPRVTALTARAQRLIGAYENRIYISSYIPTSASNDPYPQFPDIPADTADGWSFDIAPSSVEQVQWLGNGDALYILTNEASYVMTSLDPNSPPFKVFERGCLGRRAACWAEERLFYAAWDGVYAIANRAVVEELSQPIRRMYKDWLAPTSAAQVVYQGRKLFVISGTRYLRYDFVKGRWTRGTLTHTMLHAAVWRDPSGTVQNLWYLASNGLIYRWQPGDVVGNSNAASTDAGTAPPAWIYHTGYDFTPQKARVRKLYLETSGPAVQISAHTSLDDTEGRVHEFKRPSHEIPQWADKTSYQFSLRLVGLGGASVTRLLWQREAVSGEGAGTQ